MMVILSQIMFIVGVAFLILFFYSLAKERNRLAALFSIMCLLSSIYIFGYMLELRAVNLEQIKFFLKMEYFGLSFLPVFWFMFAYKVNFNKYPSFRLTSLALIIPVLTLFMSTTNEYHHLYYADVSIIEFNGHLIANLTKGPWYFVFATYSYSMLLFSTFVFYKLWQAAKYSLSTQSFWMLFGSVSLTIAFTIYLLGLSPMGLDLTPFGFLVMAISYFIALFRYNFLEMKEIIRSIVFSEISEGIIVIDDSERLIDFNNSGQKTFSWLNATNIGKSITCFEEGKKIIENADNVHEVEIMKNGQKKYYKFHVSAIKENKNSVGRVYIFQDITKEKDMLNKLNYMAYNDSLTHIYNRRKLMEEAEKELLRAQRYSKHTSVLMIDIDYFKRTNDQYGHLAGDEVIVNVVEECKKRIRRTDIIGRYGGEEFMIVLAETNSEQAISVAEDIRQRIASLDTLSKGELIRVTVSIGISTSVPEDTNIKIEELIDKADKALYSAKNLGRNKIDIA